MRGQIVISKFQIEHGPLDWDKYRWYHYKLNNFTKQWVDCYAYKETEDAYYFKWSNENEPERYLQALEEQGWETNLKYSL